MAQATREHSTPRRTASKTRTISSAVSVVQKCGFDLIPTKKRRGKLATMKDLAKIDWKPWRRTTDMKPTELIPSFEKMEDAGVHCRLAHAVMLMTRQKLIGMHSKAGHADVDKMMAGFFETAEWLKATAFMVETAYLRVMAAAAAAHEQGIKFKGVNYKAARRKAVA